MKTQEIHLPHPIPYPDNPLFKKFLRLPIILYRLGLGPLIGKFVLILSTFGRKTGKVRRTPVEYFQYQGHVFVVSGFGDRPDWYKNLNAEPLAGLNIKNKKICAKARRPETKQEWDGVIAYLKSSPIVQLSEPELIERLDDPEARDIIKTWPIFTFDTSDAPCPPPLEADLVWAWPLILLAAALILLMKWLSHWKN